MASDAPFLALGRLAEALLSPVDAARRDLARLLPGSEDAAAPEAPSPLQINPPSLSVKRRG